MAATNGNKKTATELVQEEDFNNESARNQILNAPRVMVRLIKHHEDKRTHLQGGINGVPFSYKFNEAVSMPEPVYQHLLSTMETIAEQGQDENGSNYLIPVERPSVVVQLMGEDPNAAANAKAAQLAA